MKQKHWLIILSVAQAVTAAILIGMARQNRTQSHLIDFLCDFQTNHWDLRKDFDQHVYENNTQAIRTEFILQKLVAFATASD